MLKFLVLSDLHIVEPGTFSHGLDTVARLSQAIDFVNSEHADAAFVAFAGDLTDHGDTASYELLKSTLAPLVPPAVLTLGNHDRRPEFLSVFDDHNAEATGGVDHVLDREDHRIIVLDSQDPEMGHAGRVDSRQRAWLADRLTEAADLPVIIVLHHHFAPLHVQMDELLLVEREAFVEVLQTHPDVRMVISGHVHETSTGTYAGVPYCTNAGVHYSIEPTLLAKSGHFPNMTARREGPGQIAVVVSDAEGTVVHMENFLDANARLDPELFRWS